MKKIFALALVLMLAGTSFAKKKFFIGIALFPGLRE